jgi:hypothetical protein
MKEKRQKQMKTKKGEASAVFSPVEMLVIDFRFTPNPTHSLPIVLLLSGNIKIKRATAKVTMGCICLPTSLLRWRQTYPTTPVFFLLPLFLVCHQLPNVSGQTQHAIV